MSSITGRGPLITAVFEHQLGMWIPFDIYYSASITDAVVYGQQKSHPGERLF
jgi:hypothetical protein